ncbi:VOC family protein [Metabacillus herbersteinensis]|uniref:VOC family protein n=1 Tax=Metabacillus herbersteinensis TaxID=283816 RepID=A0ABV6GIQ3_9BACI
MVTNFIVGIKKGKGGWIVDKFGVSWQLNLPN